MRLHRPVPNQKYVGDITYLPFGDGQFLYLATVVDLNSKHLVGWSIAGPLRTELADDALLAADGAAACAGRSFTATTAPDTHRGNSPPCVASSA